VEYNRGENNKDSVEGSRKATKVGAENLFCKYTSLRSLLNKKDEVGILMNGDNLDIFGITESWTHIGITD